MKKDLQRRIDELYKKGSPYEIEAFKKAAEIDFSFFPEANTEKAYKLGIEAFLSNFKIDIEPGKVYDANTFKGFAMAYLRETAKTERAKQVINQEIVKILNVGFSFKTDDAIKEANKFVDGIDMASTYFRQKNMEDFQATLVFINFPEAEKLPMSVLETVMEEYDNIFEECPDYSNNSYFSFLKTRLSDYLEKAKKARSKKKVMDYLDKALFLTYWLDNDSFILEQPFNTKEAIMDWQLAAYEANKKFKK